MSNEIKTQKFIELRATGLSFAADRYSSIKRLLKFSSKIDEELNRRSFEDLPVDKLFELSRRVNKTLNNLGEASLVFEKDLCESLSSEGIEEIDL